MATKAKVNPYSTYQVPSGYLLLNNRLSGSELHKLLNEKHHVNIDGSLGLIDIMYLDGKGVMYIDESSLVDLEECKTRIIKFKTVNQGMVMLESINFDEQFMQLQKYIVIEHKVNMMMVVSKKEAVDLLGRIIKEELNRRNNPFLIKLKPIPIETCILSALQSIPKLGSVKANVLMEKYHNLENLLSAPEEDLGPLVGKASAKVIYNFLHLGEEEINLT